MDSLKLENQLCFPLYACAKEVVRLYKPLLDPLELTYTQYIAMMVLWEKKSLTVTELGRILMLDSGTLSPMLKKMEKTGYVKRERSTSDERNVFVSITREGEELKERAKEVPMKMGHCVKLESEDAMTLYVLLNKLLKSFNG